jgi:hypothetical protein
MKECSECHELKPSDNNHFHNLKASSDGMNKRCKVCVLNSLKTPEAKSKRRIYRNRPEIKLRDKIAQINRDRKKETA